MCVYSSYKDTSAPSPFSTLCNNFQFGDNLKWVLSVVYSALTISISDDRILLFPPLITQQYSHTMYLTFIAFHISRITYTLPPPSSPQSHYPAINVHESTKRHSSSTNIATSSLIYTHVDELVGHIVCQHTDLFQSVR